MKRTRLWARQLTLWTSLAASTFTAFGLLPGCAEPTPSPSSDFGDLSLQGVVGTRPQVGPLAGASTGIAAITFKAPDKLYAGEHFHIRLGSTAKPGDATGATAILYIQDAPTAFVMGPPAFPSPKGQGNGDLWSIDLRGQLSPGFSGESRVYDVQIALIDAQGNMGQVIHWKPTLIARTPPVCPADAACGTAQCGFESACGTFCGELNGACAPGLACTFELACVPVGDACPGAQDCDAQECGIDPVCGASCGECGEGTVCSPTANVCVEDGSNTNTDTGTDSSSCQPGLVLCTDGCIDPLTDPRYCGASGDCWGDLQGTTCLPTQKCEAGLCVENCAGGTIPCQGTCINPDNNSQHCGASQSCDTDPGEVCSGGTVCSQGACKDSCDPATELLCEGTCIKPASDREHCGASADCMGANAGESCIDSEVCVGGACQEKCPDLQLECNAECIDPLSDADFCGAKEDCMGDNAGTTCKQGEFCVLGSCVMECPGTMVACGEECIDPLTTESNCGATLDCMGNNAGKTCVGGERCEAGECHNPCTNPTQVQCDANCIDPATTDAHCGAKLDCVADNAGEACTGDAHCQQGSCVAQCNADQITCGNDCVDPKTDEEHCGAAADCSGGKICGDGESCVEGDCYVVPPSCEGDIVFTDFNIDRTIRESIGKPTGPIRLKELLGIKKLGEPGGSFVPAIFSLYVGQPAGLECLLGLEQLWIVGDLTTQDAFLRHLQRLQSLWIRNMRPGPGVTALTGLRELTIETESNCICRKPPAPDMGSKGVAQPEDIMSGATAAGILEPLRGLAALRKLMISDGRGELGEIDLSPLADLPQLSELELIYGDFTGLPVEQLREVTRLKVRDANDAMLRSLAPMTNLRDLTVDGSFTDTTPISGLTKLRALSLTSSTVAFTRFSAPLTSLSNLNVLKISGPKFGDIWPIADVPSLRELAIASGELTGLPTVESMPNLEVVSVDAPIVSLSGFESHPKLTSLNVASRSALTDISQLATIPALRVLGLVGTNTAELSVIGSLAQLESLTLDSNMVEGRLYLSDIGFVSALTNLQTLSISSNAVMSLAPLAKMTKLQKLELSFNEISDISPLYKLPNLQTLVVWYNKIACTAEERAFAKRIVDAGGTAELGCEN